MSGDPHPDEGRGIAPRLSYSPLHQLLHWATLALFLVQLWTYPAIGRTHHAPHFGVPIDPFDLLLHKVHLISGGVIFVFVVARLGLRWLYPIAPARSVHPLLEWLAKAVHFSLYALLVLLPVSGFLRAYIVSAAGPVHIVLTKLFYILLALHIAGALAHAVLWRDGLLARMGVKLPFQR